MNKNILSDYIDACELIKETEEDIRKLRKQEFVHDKVSGSNPEFPYQPKNFVLNGTVEVNLDDTALKKEKELLQQRKENARQIKIKVEEIMSNAPMRIQRIIRYRYIERKSWDETVCKMGHKCTVDSLRKELKRYLEEN